jgi:hypothetical protein
MWAQTFFSIPSWLREILADPFRRYLSLALACLAVALIWGHPPAQPVVAPPANGPYIDFFFHPQCPHCLKQKAFNNSLRLRYPALTIVEHDTSKPEQGRLLAEFMRRRGMAEQKVSVPATFIGQYSLFGFHSIDTTGVTIDKALTAYLRHDPTIFRQPDTRWGEEMTVMLPLVGELRLAEYSLPVLAVVIGLVDGFNPCAMWVLVYLISLICALNDRRKIWLLVGTFVLASGVLYFLFMTAWLNLFLVIGYLRPLTVLIGVAALGVGINNIREYLISKGELACTITDSGSKQRTMGRIERVVAAPISLVAIANIIVLAFIINSIEFVCSAALPAIFTHTLALRKLSGLAYYGYILLYDLFFMLDDLIIFSLAVLALDTTLGNRYAKHCKIIGGCVLTVLGLLLAFKPEWLR